MPGPGSLRRRKGTRGEGTAGRQRKGTGDGRVGECMSLIGLPWGLGPSSDRVSELAVQPGRGPSAERKHPVRGQRGLGDPDRERSESPTLLQARVGVGLPGSSAVQGNMRGWQEACNPLLPSPVCTQGKEASLTPNPGVPPLLKNLRASAGVGETGQREAPAWATRLGASSPCPLGPPLPAAAGCPGQHPQPPV